MAIARRTRNHALHRLEGTFQSAVPALPEVRAFVRWGVAALGVPVPPDRATILAHELVVNAIALDAGDVRVALTEGSFGSLRVEVRDDGLGRPEVRPTTFGLRIVDAEADRWGVDEFLPGKIVWFEIDRVGT